MIESSTHTESALDGAVPSQAARKMVFAGCEPRCWSTSSARGVGSVTGARVATRARGDVGLPSRLDDSVGQLIMKKDALDEASVDSFISNLPTTTQL